jgi:DNA-binding transcriptional regulator YhcF (GntR family)
MVVGAYGLGSRSQPIYAELRRQIVHDHLAPGQRLPSHQQLAALYGVAPMTVRHVLARLEAEGLVVREQGRGTFVRRRRPPAVLVVDDEPYARGLLSHHVQEAGLSSLEADGPAAALRLLAARGGDVVLVLTDVRMPESSDGLGLIKTIRRRWPRIPVAAVTGFADDLAPLQHTPEWPFLVIPKPVRGAQLARLFALIVPGNGARDTGHLAAFAAPEGQRDR